MILRILETASYMQYEIVEFKKALLLCGKAISTKNRKYAMRERLVGLIFGVCFLFLKGECSTGDVWWFGYMDKVGITLESSPLCF